MNVTRKWIFKGLLLLPLLALAAFCVFYLTHDYAYLTDWYEAIPGPFFRKSHWRREFFTPQTAQAGRLYCGLALLLIPLLAWTVLRQKTSPPISLNPADRLPQTIVALLALILGTANALLSTPAIDEYQSAFFMGGAHPFRALSHYPVPNNHVLFNTLTSLIATPETALVWGKIIAIGAFAVAAVLIYRWFRTLSLSPAVAAWLAGLSLLIFPVWGFSGQARGYTIYLLAHWWALLLTTRYLQTGDKRHLVLFPVAVWMGYAALPTFIYFHLALTLWVGCLALTRRKIYLPFWKAQVIGSIAAYLFYVPLLCFSGFRAFSAHRWVAHLAWQEFSFPPLGPFRDYLTGYGAVGLLLGIGTLLLALRLLLSSKNRWMGMLFLAVWIGCNLVVLWMRQPSFSRQLIGLYSVSVGVALYSLRLLIENAGPVVSGKKGLKTLAALSLLGALGVFKINYHRLNDALYLYDIAGTERRIEILLDRIPAGATVGFTDDAFHARALWQRAGKKPTPFMAATYRVLLEDTDSPLPTDTLVFSYGDLELYTSRDKNPETKD